MPLTLEEIGKLLDLLRDRDLTELSYEHEGFRLRIVRQPGGGLGAALEGAASSAAGPAAEARRREPAAGSAAPAAAAPEEAAGSVVVKSPIVGTFYRSPDPNSPVFVNVGDRVRVGQVLCIVEAMKLMNEIEAELAGEILKIHPQNGQPVQYGDPLFTLRPEA